MCAKTFTAVRNTWWGGACVLRFPYFIFNHENYDIAFAIRTSLNNAWEPGNSDVSELIPYFRYCVI